MASGVLRKLQWIAVVTLMAHAGDVLAQGGLPRCAELPNPIYMTGTTAVEPLVRRMGAKLRKLSDPHTLLWNDKLDGCISVVHMTWPDQATASTAGTFNYFEEVESNGTIKIVTKSCNPPKDKLPDLAINDVFYQSCSWSREAAKNPGSPYGILPANIKEFIGPVQGLTPIVASSYLFYKDITREELARVYVCGKQGAVLTFVDDNYLFNYELLSGMHELWAQGLAVPSSLLQNFGLLSTEKVTATNAMEKVASSTNPEFTLAYTSTEVYDENRDKVRALKVRGLKQKLAYWPDSDLTSRDKINIREGRYTIMAALKMVTKIDAAGEPIIPAARKIIDWFLDRPLGDPNLKLPFNIVDVYAQSGVVPQCAMRVTKDTDAPVFRPYQDARPCHCYFEKQATGTLINPGCVACVENSSCGDGKICSYGYCESSPVR